MVPWVGEIGVGGGAAVVVGVEVLESSSWSERVSASSSHESAGSDGLDFEVVGLEESFDEIWSLLRDVSRALADACAMFGDTMLVRGEGGRVSKYYITEV
jgi:hypothetical protein